MSNSEVKEFYEKYPCPSDVFNCLEDLEINKWILNTLDKKPSGKILNAGCGTGEESLFLSQYGQVTGMDFSENSLNRAKELTKKFNKNIRFIQDDLLNPKHNEKYDYIFCIGVIHHIEDINLAIENLKTFMDQDTSLIVAIANKYGRRNPKKNKNPIRNMDTFEHPFTLFHSKREAIKLFEKHDLEIKKIWRNIPDIIRIILNKGSIMTFHLKLKNSQF